MTTLPRGLALLLALAGAPHPGVAQPSAVDVAVEPALRLPDRLAPDQPDMRAITSPDWAEPAPAPTLRTSSASAAVPSTADAFGVIAPAARQPLGALSGKIVFMNCGHGWTYDSTFSPPWRLMRPVLNDMNEDHGNIDQLNFFAAYCFNAGAVVVPFRPLGQQTNEVVLDNTSAGVSFSGAWSDSTSTIFYGSAGAVPYRYASLDTVESATATYTPNLPATGYYPVYTWVRHGSDRGDQLYRIRHTGGESQVRIPHYMAGNGWIYLGEYYLNAGASATVGSVVISNLRSTTNGGVVIADAIRFGNGMGSADTGGGGSHYPRECESDRYWIKNSLGQGQSTSLYDGSGTDEADSWSAPPKMTAEMNRELAGSIYDRIHISFHSNAGGGRGAMGLITTDPTPNQSALAQTAGQEVNSDLVALGAPPLELPWYNRTTYTYSGGYSEITGSLFNYEMDATIIEVAFHDDVSDAKLLCDPKARAAVGKAALHAVIKHLNHYNTNNPPPLAFLPEPPSNPRALASANGGITLSWTTPISLGGSQSPTNYVLYRSTNGYGFGNPISVGMVLTYTFTNLAADTDYYFRVAAANGGGESMPSEVVGCRASSVAGQYKVLVVNAFDRFDRTTNLRMNTTAQNYAPPGPSGTIERVWPRAVNSFDYVVPHGKSLAVYGMAFDSCQRQAVTSGQVSLSGYPIVIWAAGQSLTNTFRSTEQSLLSSFLNAGGHLFVSGAKIAFDLDRAAGPAAADRNFLKNQLHADLASDANTNAGSYTVTAVAGSVFAGNTSATYDDGSKGIYWVQTADVLTPYGTGTSAALNYSGVSGRAAAIQYNGAAGGGKVVYFGFPFETITASARREEYLADILNFFSLPLIKAQPQSLLVNEGANATLTAVTAGAPPLSFQWRWSGTNLSGATAYSFTRTNVAFGHAGDYSVVITNRAGALTSAVAILTVNRYPLASNLLAAAVVDHSLSLPTAQLLLAAANPDGDALALSGVSLTSTNGGSATLSADTVVFTPLPGFLGTDQFGYTVTDIHGAAASGSVTVLVRLAGDIAGGFSSPLASTNGFRLKFAGVPGLSYTLQRAPSLAGPWTRLSTIVVGMGGSIEYEDPAPPAATAYYRTVYP